MYVKIDGLWLSVLELQNGLHQIYTDMKTRINMNPMIHRVQILTSDVRSTWAMNRQTLIKGIYKTMTYLHDCTYMYVIHIIPPLNF